MKELHLWVCEKCHAQYKTPEEAAKCEKGHRIPQRITNTYYRPITVDQSGYPFQMYVRFDDGDEIVYERK